MIYVFLFYGLSFIALGLVIGLQARSPVPALPRAALWFLAAFGFLHGAHEWVEMADLCRTGGSAHNGDPVLLLGDVVLAAASFACLLQYAVEALIKLDNWPRWLRAAPGGIFLLLAAIFVALELPSGAIAGPEGHSIGQALSRYFLGFPGALLAAYSLFVARKRQTEVTAHRLKAYLAGGALAFTAYALFTGIVVPPAPFPPASLVNSEGFLAVVHVPVEVFRGICAALIAAFLSEAFVIETARFRWRAEQLRDESIMAMAHDLRSPVTTINLNAGLLQRMSPLEHNGEGERRLLGNILASARTINWMVDNLLEASRLEFKVSSLKRERMDLRRLVYDVADRARELAKGHQIKVTAPDSVPPVEADPNQIERLLSNLLSNAAKYSFSGMDILIEVEPRPAEVVVSITNYGPGISAEEQRRLFTRFYRTGSAEAAGAPGLGLGLYVAKGIVEAHSGRIWVESEVNRYATFRFTLPRASA
ncbi:MAG: HAMP domain-containing histidine kinase [Chloroflexi bacterium]|nr:HAMP domain-containing histidine kinase [Chloroflexota bacterium]